MLYPLLFKPVLKDYIWGGRNLEKKLGRKLPSEGTFAESWEIAGHKAGTTAVLNGSLAGTSLTDLLDRYGLDLIGTRSQWAYERDKFPLLIKILDANRTLSVQVHPDDKYALANEGNELGKTEMWVVLDAKPGAEIILGVAEGTTRGNFRDAVEAGALESHLHRIPVQSGDHICVPAGSLHAIMDGLLIAEIQQNSNTTYRVYDWNRVGHDGQPRPLHVDQALDVINFDQVEPTLPHPTAVSEQQEQLCRNQYFTVERVKLAADKPFNGHNDGQTFEIWGVITGQATVSGADTAVDLSAVQFVLLPAVLGDFQIKTDDTAVCLRVYVGES
jgi:mannose-6-phosphate isomerase